MSKDANKLSSQQSSINLPFPLRSFCICLWKRVFHKTQQNSLHVTGHSSTLQALVDSSEPPAHTNHQIPTQWYYYLELTHEVYQGLSKGFVPWDTCEFVFWSKEESMIIISIHITAHIFQKWQHCMYGDNEVGSSSREKEHIYLSSVALS